MAPFCNLLIEQGSHQPGKPGIVREFERSGIVREKSGNSEVGQGKLQLFICLICTVMFIEHLSSINVLSRSRRLKEMANVYQCKWNTT
jgi:hypothetical protein